MGLVGGYLLFGEWKMESGKWKIEGSGDFWYNRREYKLFIMDDETEPIEPAVAPEGAETPVTRPAEEPEIDEASRVRSEALSDAEASRRELAPEADASATAAKAKEIERSGEPKAEETATSEPKPPEPYELPDIPVESDYMTPQEHALMEDAIALPGKEWLKKTKWIFDLYLAIAPHLNTLKCLGNEECIKEKNKQLEAVQGVYDMIYGSRDTRELCQDALKGLGAKIEMIPGEQDGMLVLMINNAIRQKAGPDGKPLAIPKELECIRGKNKKEAMNTLVIRYVDSLKSKGKLEDLEGHVTTLSCIVNCQDTMKSPITNLVAERPTDIPDKIEVFGSEYGVVVSGNTLCVDGNCCKVVGKGEKSKDEFIFSSADFTRSAHGDDQLRIVIAKPGLWGLGAKTLREIIIDGDLEVEEFLEGVKEGLTVSYGAEESQWFGMTSKVYDVEIVAVGRESGGTEVASTEEEEKKGGEESGEAVSATEVETASGDSA